MDDTATPQRKGDAIALLVGQALVTIVGIAYVWFLQFDVTGCTPAACDQAGAVIYIAVAAMIVILISTTIAVFVVLHRGGRATVLPIVGVAIVVVIAIATVVAIKTIV